MEGIVEQNVVKSSDIEMVEKPAAEEEFYEDGNGLDFGGANVDGGGSVDAALNAGGGAPTNGEYAEDGFDYRTSPGGGGRGGGFR